MAELVDAMPPASPIRRQSYYPWHEWLDGRIWKLTEGEDFKTTARNFQINIGHVRRRLGFEVVTRRIGKTVFVQAMIGDAGNGDSET